MERMAGFLGGTVGSWIGWKLGAPLGLFAAFVVSTIGTGVGVFFAKRLARHHWG